MSAACSGQMLAETGLVLDDDGFGFLVVPHGRCALFHRAWCLGCLRFHFGAEDEHHVRSDAELQVDLRYGPRPLLQRHGARELRVEAGGDAEAIKEDIDKKRCQVCEIQR